MSGTTNLNINLPHSSRRHTTRRLLCDGRVRRSRFVDAAAAATFPHRIRRDAARTHLPRETRKLN